MAELGALLDRLRRGEMPALVLDDVDALVAWLCGKGSREAGPDDDPLPVPEHDPVLLQMVFYRLDATLFNGGELNLKAAGLDAGQSDKQRKARFRRLAGAFHPDRHPVLADWLTARSQIVLQAYGRFKHQHGEPPPVDPVPPSPGAPEAPRHMRPKGARRHSRRRLRGLLLRLRQRFGHDRFLAHKLIGGLAVIALLPVLNLLLVPAPGPPGNEESVSLQSGAADSPARQSGAADSPARQSGAADSSVRHSGAADSSVRHSGAADSSVRHSGAAEGGTRNLPDVPPTQITAPNEIPDHASGASGTTGEGGTSATTGEEGASGTSGDGIPGRTDGAATESVPDTQLRLAARRAMTLYGDEPGASGSRPSVDEQLRQMGLETDTERLYRRMMEGQPAPSEVPDRADGASGTTGEGSASATTGEEGASPTPRHSGAADSSVRHSGAAEGGTRNLPGEPPTRITAPNEIPDHASGVSGTTGEGSASATTGEEGVSPTPRHSGAADSSVRHSGAAEGGTRNLPGEPPTRITAPNEIPDHASGVSATTGEGGASPTPRHSGAAEGGTRNLPGEPPTRITAPNEIPDHASGVSGTTGEEGTPATTGVAGPERLPPLDPGALVLGPMASSPPGQLLAGLKRDLEQGNLAGLMSRFAGRARHDGLRGVDEIAAHYRELFEHLAPRQVDLRARRIARDGDGWRVEADLAIRGYRAGDLVTARDGRVVLRLDQRDGRLQIARLEP